MQGTIAVIVLGAIGLVIFAAVSPTLFGSFGDTYQQTQATCVYQGERFTAVNSEQDWEGTASALSAGASGVCAIAADASARTVYTPDGVGIPLAASVTSITGAEWGEALAIMTEQGGINRLVITILPLLTVIGAIALLYNWRGHLRWPMTSLVVHFCSAPLVCFVDALDTPA